MVGPDEPITLAWPYWYVRNPKTSEILEAISNGAKVVTLFDDHAEAEKAACGIGNDFIAVEISDLQSLLLFVEFLRKDGCENVGFRDGPKFRCFATGAVILAIEIGLGRST